MRASLAACAVVAGCTFTPNPGASPSDGNPGSEPAPPGIDAAHADSAAHDAAIDAPPDTPTITVLPCPLGYAALDSAQPGSRYRQVTASASWQAAEADCEDDEVPAVTGPAHLVVLDDAAEATYFWTLMNSDQWIGHTDLITEATFLAVTDQPTVYTGPATANSPTKDCLMIHNTGGQTNADTCTNSHPYVCECDGRAANPTHF
jgi:hypothetical protein